MSQLGLKPESSIRRACAIRPLRPHIGRIAGWVALVAMALLVWSPIASSQDDRVANQSKASSGSVDPGNEIREVAGQSGEWQSLMPKQPFSNSGSSLAPWKPTPFVRPGVVELRSSVDPGDSDSLHPYIHLAVGDRLTGITYAGDELPKENFEVELETARLSGNDFLCGLTFPVGEEWCSFIAGGWSDTVVGLSSINGNDASENETTLSRSFENDRWYRFRVRVVPDTIQAWIDDEKVIEHHRDGNSYEVRLDIEDSRPLGICAYESAVNIRKVRWRRLVGINAQPVASDQNKNRGDSSGEEH